MWVYMLRRKNEVLLVFERFKRMAENKEGVR